MKTPLPESLYDANLLTKIGGLTAADLARQGSEVFNRFLASLTEAEASELKYFWPFWARPDQRFPSGDFFVWLILSGRGWGKTRTGAETVLDFVRRGLWGRVSLIAETASDCRDVMVEGDSGILSIAPPSFRPQYLPSKRRLTFPNGAIAICYSAEDPEQMRGPQQDGAWCDEIAKWRYRDSWDQCLFGTRLGPDPRVIATTTPRPTSLIIFLHRQALLTRQLALRLPADSSSNLPDWTSINPDTLLRVHITTGSTYDNLSNLAPSFRAAVLSSYEQSRLGQQEIEGRLLLDASGALWAGKTIEATRVTAAPPLDQFAEIVVAVDPTVRRNKNEQSEANAGYSADSALMGVGALRHERDAETEGKAECGIIIAGRTVNNHCYVLADRSIRGNPDIWAHAVVHSYHEFQANLIIAEANQGGTLVEQTIRAADDDSSHLPVSLVYASRGKQTRAEPVSRLYSRRLIHHVGVFPELEAQLCSWEPGDPSPDRLDALVWAIYALKIEERNDEAPGILLMGTVKGWSTHTP